MAVETRVCRDLESQLNALGLKPAGRITTRTAAEIGASPWSIGCETIDRAYVEFAGIRDHLGDLGATAARVQAGWARCEPQADGVYQWAWLDEVVDGCVAQGVRPWLQTSYGNPRYDGGGGIGLSQGLPSSATALTAWDRWANALVLRYRDRVDTWEIWNEPDHRGAMTPAHYAAFYLRTAEIIRSAQPAARLVALALSGNFQFAEQFLADIAERQRADLIDEVSFHFYPHNPDDGFNRVAALAELVHRYAPRATLRQGETGAPSETDVLAALHDFPWNQRKQAVWNLRRMLAHHVRGLPASLFQLADMYYSTAGGARYEGRNSKGLLHINPDKTVAHRKASYAAMQHLYALLDNRFDLTPLTPLAASAPFAVEAYAWTPRSEPAPAIIAWWRSDAAPELETPALQHISLNHAPPAGQCLLLDFLSGAVFQTPPPTGATMHLPCTDTPLALVRRELVRLRPDHRQLGAG